MTESVYSHRPMPAIRRRAPTKVIALMAPFLFSGVFESDILWNRLVLLRVISLCIKYMGLISVLEYLGFCIVLLGFDSEFLICFF